MNHVNNWKQQHQKKFQNYYQISYLEFVIFGRNLNISTLQREFKDLFTKYPMKS